MNRLRKAVALGSAALLACSLAACSSSSGDEGDVTITWWATNLASSLERDQEVLTPIIKRFTDETGIKVDFEVNDWGDYYNKVLGAVSSGEGPDVMSVGTTWTQTLADTGAFLQLDDKRMTAVGGRDKFLGPPLAAAGGDAKGGPSFLPMVSGVNNLWYNPKLFAAAGIDGPPRTWSEFVADARALTKDTNGDGTIDQWGFGYPAGMAVELSHLIFAVGRQEGGQMFGTDGKPTLDSDGLVKAAKLITDLMATDKVLSPADVESTATTDTFQDFIDGRVAMTIGPSPVPTFTDAKFTDYAGADMPLVEPLVGDPIMTHVAGVNIGVFAETKHEDAALKLMRYLTDEAAQVDFYRDFDVLPTNRATYDSPQIEKTPLFETYANILAKHADTFPLNSKTGQAETLIGDAMKQLFAQAALKGPLSEAQIRDVLTKANTQLIAAG